MPRTPGETAGPYKLLSLIGEGGMGRAFSASDDGQRFVLLKSDGRESGPAVAVPPCLELKGLNGLVAGKDGK